MERCQSGRMCSLGKRVWVKPPRVRIPLSPPKIAYFRVIKKIIFILKIPTKKTSEINASFLVTLNLITIRNSKLNFMVLKINILIKLNTPEKSLKSMFRKIGINSTTFF